MNSSTMLSVLLAMYKHFMKYVILFKTMQYKQEKLYKISTKTSYKVFFRRINQ